MGTWTATTAGKEPMSGETTGNNFTITFPENSGTTDDVYLITYENNGCRGSTTYTVKAGEECQPCNPNNYEFSIDHSEATVTNCSGLAPTTLMSIFIRKNNDEYLKADDVEVECNTASASAIPIGGGGTTPIVINLFKNNDLAVGSTLKIKIKIRNCPEIYEEYTFNVVEAVKEYTIVAVNKRNTSIRLGGLTGKYKLGDGSMGNITASFSDSDYISPGDSGTSSPFTVRGCENIENWSAETLTINDAQSQCSGYTENFEVRGTKLSFDITTEVVSCDCSDDCYCYSGVTRYFGSPGVNPMLDPPRATLHFCKKTTESFYDCEKEFQETLYAEGVMGKYEYVFKDSREQLIKVIYKDDPMTKEINAQDGTVEYKPNCTHDLSMYDFPSTSGQYMFRITLSNLPAKYGLAETIQVTGPVYYREGFDGNYDSVITVHCN